MNPKIKTQLSWQKIGDEVLIMDTVYQKKAHTLNSTAALIWQHCTGENSTDQITQIIRNEFDVSETQAKVDLEEVLLQLKSLDLLES
tara:strand:- start:150 stop:410 length:261 start_codon:yes stop_codon:yes gene_type:complete